MLPEGTVGGETDPPSSDTAELGGYLGFAGNEKSERIADAHVAGVGSHPNQRRGSFFDTDSYGEPAVLPGEPGNAASPMGYRHQIAGRG